MKYLLIKNRAVSRPGMQMGDCPTCKQRMTFLGRKCIRCGAMLPAKKKAS